MTEVKNWPRYAKALDLRLEGKLLKEIAAEFNVSNERARQMVKLAKQQLAFRVFRGVPRPLPPPRW
jgi:orotate phosphoribosyltransferase-like protein